MTAGEHSSSRNYSSADSLSQIHFWSQEAADRWCYVHPRCYCCRMKTKLRRFCFCRWCKKSPFHWIAFSDLTDKDEPGPTTVSQDLSIPDRASHDRAGKSNTLCTHLFEIVPLIVVQKLARISKSPQFCSLSWAAQTDKNAEINNLILKLLFTNKFDG